MVWVQTVLYVSLMDMHKYPTEYNFCKNQDNTFTWITSQLINCKTQRRMWHEVFHCLYCTSGVNDNYLTSRHFWTCWIIHSCELCSCESVPFDKVSEVIDRDGRAHPTVTCKNMVYDGSVVILEENRREFCSIRCCWCQHIMKLQLLIYTSQPQQCNHWQVKIIDHLIRTAPVSGSDVLGSLWTFCDWPGSDWDGKSTAGQSISWSAGLVSVPGLLVATFPFTPCWLPGACALFIWQWAGTRIQQGKLPEAAWMTFLHGNSIFLIPTASLSRLMLPAMLKRCFRNRLSNTIQRTNIIFGRCLDCSGWLVYFLHHNI